MAEWIYGGPAQVDTKTYTKRELVAHEIAAWITGAVDASLVAYQWDRTPLELREDWLKKADIIIELVHSDHDRSN